MGEPALKRLKGSVRPVLLFPEPLLKQPCEQVGELSAEVMQVVEDLVETMLALPRCVGLAAPQLGVTRRIVVVDVSRHPKAPARNHGLLCLINPKLVLTAGQVVTREGCVSVPDFTANVARAEHVAINYLDCEGAPRALEASGFEAIALQHELDHLDGKLFLDRVTAADIFRRKK